MSKKTTRSSSSSDDLHSQHLLSNLDSEKCTFTDRDIKLLEPGGSFPKNTVFRSFDPKTRTDFTSDSWVCFPSFPFTKGFSYHFPAFTTKFFEKTGLSYAQTMPVNWRTLHTLEILIRNHALDFSISELAYFSEVAPPSSETAKRVLFFYNIELTERTFTQSVAESSETYPSGSEMSGVRMPSSKFALEDIDSMLSKGKNTKKEACQPSFPTTKPEAPKPESSTARPKSTSHKKRKLVDHVELAISECSDYADLHKRLHTLGHLALEKMTKIHEALVKEAEEAKQMADDKDFDRSKWDVQEWQRLVAELGGEPVQEASVDAAEGSAKVAEEHGAAVAGKQVDQGDDGNDA
ncbi:hypothetical protein L1987_07603 [Smallanthus sonchifolius]|uniref:Uncharacterized protein n=1 Tax=Smallanthus sonchifolius TaxID=185202 RepID=A0ACB9K0Y3_9ASTR|nr:hypothetical protein L1987_07603 [Smallanthus sonchifolius]